MPFAIIKKWGELRFARAFFRFVEDPKRTDELFKMGDAQLRKTENKNTPIFKAMYGHLKDQPKFMKCWDEKYLPPLPRLSELKRLPVGSLGHAYAEHMIQQGLDPDFYPSLVPSTVVYYLAKRMRQTHDLWHVLTGLTTSKEDELRLQGFTLGQLKTGFPAMVLSATILHILRHRPEEITGCLEAYYESYKWGGRAQFLPGIKLEDRLSENLESLREELGLLPLVKSQNTLLVDS